jgi:DNA-binding LytR/AlgR family response regulator
MHLHHAEENPGFPGIQIPTFEITIAFITFKPNHMSNQYIYFRKDRKLKKLDVDEIGIMEVIDNYVRFYTDDGKTYTARTTLDAALKKIPAGRFLRIHRAYAVAYLYIDRFDKEELYLRGSESSIPVSKLYYEKFIKQLVILDEEGPVKMLKKSSQPLNFKTVDDT